MGNFDSKDFDRNEILRTINSAYSNTHNFGTKYYEDEDKVNLIKQQLRRGVNKTEIKCHIQNDKIDEENIDQVINKLEEEQTENKFWEKSEKGKIKIIHSIVLNLSFYTPYKRKRNKRFCIRLFITIR